MSKPKVSIVSISYNQEKYIREALEGFVNQKTDFDFEIIIGDDASKDSTPAIISEYAKKYPALFKPVLHKKNLGSWPNFLDTIKRAEGKYIALCEGDDFWTDPDKLQRQVDFLDAHPDYALCFHPVKVIFQDGSQPDAVFPEGFEASEFTVKNLLENNFIQTNSVIYRKQDYDQLAPAMTPGDWYLHLFHAQFGKIGFINNVMSVYRRHPGGIWWDAGNGNKAFWEKHGLAHLHLYAEIYKLFSKNKAYEKILLAHVYELIDRLADLDSRNDSKLLQMTIETYPEFAIRYMRHAQQEFFLLHEQAIDLKQKLEVLDDVNHQLIGTLEAKTKELDVILSSRTWRLRNRLRKDR